MWMCGKANEVEILFQWKFQATVMKAGSIQILTVFMT